MNRSNLSDREEGCGDQWFFEVGDRCANPAGPGPTGDFNGESDRGDKGNDVEEEGDDSVCTRHEDPGLSNG